MKRASVDQHDQNSSQTRRPTKQVLSDKFMTGFDSRTTVDVFSELNSFLEGLEAVSIKRRRFQVQGVGIVMMTERMCLGGMKTSDTHKRSGANSDNEEEATEEAKSCGPEDQKVQP